MPYRSHDVFYLLTNQRETLLCACTVAKSSVFVSPRYKSAAKNQIGQYAPKSRFSSIRPLPTPPSPPKGKPPTISTDDIEQYVQPLYARGWGFSRILPNGNGIAVLRKRFDFANDNALKGFLADLREYEERAQVRFLISFHSTFTFTLSLPPGLVPFCANC